MAHKSLFHAFCNRRAVSAAALVATLVGASRLAIGVELVAADVIVVPPDANDILKKQFRGQLEPILKVELSFVNRVCQLDDDERRRLIAKCNEWFDGYLDGYATAENQPRIHGVWFGGVQAAQGESPRVSIETNVAKIVAVELPKEKAERYDAERKKRAEFAKSIHLESLVSRLDDELILSPDQREKIVAAMSEKWDDRWTPQPELFMHGMDRWDMMPKIPDELVRPHLTEAQSAAWEKLNRNTGQMIFGGVGVEGQVVDDIDLHEDEAKADAANQEVGPQPAPELFYAPQ